MAGMRMLKIPGTLLAVGIGEKIRYTYFTTVLLLRGRRLKMAALALPRRTSWEWSGVVAGIPKPA
jgi:hypothetical protein